MIDQLLKMTDKIKMYKIIHTNTLNNCHPPKPLEQTSQRRRNDELNQL